MSRGLASILLLLAVVVRSDAAQLRIATWNLEWLMTPATMRDLRPHCASERPKGRRDPRALPCDVAAELDRSAADFAALAGYARNLAADVVALQEVDGPEAAALVFRGYSFCFTRRRALQNNGFAVRRGLPYRCGADFEPLSLDGAVRSGAELILYPDDAREIRLLSVHLKSGCGARLLDAPTDACRDLARQVAPLESWIDAQAAAGRRFAVLGDFNRELLRDVGPAKSPEGALQRLWPEIDDGEPVGADLTNAAQGEPFLNCGPHQAFPGYIDHILLGERLRAQYEPRSFRRLTYLPRDAVRRKLSDHCPVSIRVDIR